MMFEDCPILEIYRSVYLISIAVANKTKGQFYDANLPGLEDVRISSGSMVVRNN